VSVGFLISTGVSSTAAAAIYRLNRVIAMHLTDAEIGTDLASEAEVLTTTISSYYVYAP
jgi:hypothetical protein